MSYRAVLRCLAGCPGEHVLTEPVYSCQRCGGLLDVVHDEDALTHRSGAEWKSLFDARFSRVGWPGASGVWSKREWVAPEIPEDSIVSIGEGGTPLVRAEAFGRSIGATDLWIKQCGNSHTGSFKDLGMTVLVSVVRHAFSAGLSSRPIACASTGDTSASLAAYGAWAGLPVVVLLPRGRVSTAQLVQPLASGALVLSLDTDFDGCMAIVQQLAADGDIYLANSMNALRLEGQKTVAIELTQQLDWRVPDWVVVPSGNLGNAYALFAGFRLMKALGVTDAMPRLCVAQAANANPLYLAWKSRSPCIEPQKARETLATAIQIGNPVSAPRAMRALEGMNGVVEQASEDELASAAARADRTGFYVDPHTAVALACLEKQARAGVIEPGQRVVVVSTANALKFTEFKVRYHERAIEGVSSAHANEPVVLPAEHSKVSKAIAEYAERIARGDVGRAAS